MNPHDAELLRALADALRPHLQRSEPLRRLAGAIGRWLVAESETTPQVAAPTVPPHVAPVPPARPEQPHVVSTPHAVVIPPARTGPLAVVPLRLGDTTVTVPVRGIAADVTRAVEAADRIERPETPRPPPPDLGLIQIRTRLKAQSCRVFIERRSAAGDPEREPALVSRVSEMIAHAKALPGCFLWVFFREKPQPPDEVLRAIAECYDALADAAELVSEVESVDESAPAAEAFRLLAEANSALRVSLERTWLTSPDADQDQAHAWLRTETDHRGIFVPRHMRLDDPADPAMAADLRLRIAALREGHRSRQSALKQAGKFLNQARYHAHQIAEKPPEDADHDWKRLAAAVAALAGAGIEPEDPRVAEAVAAVRGREPADVDALVLRALAAQPQAPQPQDVDEPMPERGWSERVAEVRALLAGRRIVIIGGEPRPEAIARIEEAFGLSGCDWVRLSEHGSGRPMEAPIGHAETALVLVLIKLTGHLHAEEAREHARASGKPLVMLKAGYNPEQIAQAVQEQAAVSLARAN